MFTKEKMMAIVHGEFALHNRGNKRYGCHVVGFQSMIQAFGSCVYSPNDAFPTTYAWDPRVKSFFFL